MSRIFMSLSLLPVLLVFTTMGLGWWIGDYNDVYRQVIQADTSVGTVDHEKLDRDLARLREPQRRFTYHFQMGLASALTVVLINSLSVTYLIGTSRWVKEVSEAYEMDDTFVDRSKKLKRATFPWSVVGVVSIIAIVALGAAADPGALLATSARWVTPHLLAAMLGSSAIVLAIIVQAMNLHRHSQVIADVVEAVRQEREARGLPVE